MSTIAASHSCVWLMTVGGTNAFPQMVSSCVFLELSEWHNEITDQETDRVDDQ